MSAARFTERNVIRTLILQGAQIHCYRTKRPITLENVEEVEREHNIPTAIGGENTPWNCHYSLKDAHAEQTKVDRKTISKTRKLSIARLAKAEVEERVGNDPGFRLKKKMDGSVVRVRTR